MLKHLRLQSPTGKSVVVRLSQRIDLDGRVRAKTYAGALVLLALLEEDDFYADAPDIARILTSGILDSAQKEDVSIVIRLMERDGELYHEDLDLLWKCLHNFPHHTLISRVFSQFYCEGDEFGLSYEHKGKRRTIPIYSAFSFAPSCVVLSHALCACLNSLNGNASVKAQLFALLCIFRTGDSYISAYKTNVQKYAGGIEFSMSSKPLPDFASLSYLVADVHTNIAHIRIDRDVNYPYYVAWGESFSPTKSTGVHAYVVDQQDMICFDPWSDRMIGRDIDSFIKRTLANNQRVTRSTSYWALCLKRHDVYKIGGAGWESWMSETKSPKLNEV